MTRYGETSADDLFRADAEAQGYLKPGGKGLWAYYRDNGMTPPEYLEKTVPKHEQFGVDWGSTKLYGQPMPGADLDGSPLPAQPGRHSSPVVVE